jgi:hypothetical protein
MRRISALALLVLVGCSAHARIVSKDSSRGEDKYVAYVICGDGPGGKEPLDDVAKRACPAPSFLQRFRCGSQVEGISTAMTTASPDADSVSRPIGGPCCEYGCVVAIP